MQIQCVCVVCDGTFERTRLNGNYHGRYKLCDKCQQWHKWCSFGRHAPVQSRFAPSGDKLQHTCTDCLPQLRGSVRAMTCHHCQLNFVVFGGRGRFNGRGVTLCDDCYQDVKHCRRCDLVKPLAEFAPSKDKACGTVAFCYECVRAGWRKLPAKRRASPKLARFGLTYDQYTAMRQTCKDLCAICGLPETDVANGKVRTLAIDHCHTSGAVRGLLCGHCNKALGHMADDPKRLRAAADYIEKHASLAQ